VTPLDHTLTNTALSCPSANQLTPAAHVLGPKPVSGVIRHSVLLSSFNTLCQETVSWVTRRVSDNLTCLKECSVLFSIV